MTVEEGRQAIDQMDANAQVVAESSRRSGQGRSARPGVRRCGVCGQPGHNARTCQVVIETSGEEYTHLSVQLTYQFIIKNLDYYAGIEIYNYNNYSNILIKVKL
ncbi:uncharacterized protein NECHADRAFT_89548 [Fusarium vanettenii 77-13-4]|uniref:CCHC-type domain-containing protein n=1 Tax=Fusarium vanettenii (strain ATCC MYA-4622 / CBS 123669 / FGSC 9596 / NRRL 45880 / 77-13-4) TaxID=660122 RepID=C7ZRL9_FUSV7|nr:uncharacterized protein NECHADRAFT_89548 [Fusarium vanettenii 77-13-4]EEU33335.1 hypothetical protein NECHADRAFT_89548 [Fusarium vanettenii 77-13-4]